MKSLNVKILEWIAGTILAVNGLGAIFGGWHLMMYPDGSSIGLPMNLLQYSTFDNYLVPGIILFVFNGCLSITALVLLLGRHSKRMLFAVLQGLILCIWISVQMILFREIFALQLVMLTLGLVLIYTGVRSLRISSEK